MALLVVMGLLGPVGGTNLSLEQHAYAKPSEKKDPCKAFKLLAKYVEGAGLQAVTTGNDDMMLTLVDDYRHYSREILQYSPPDNGKC